MPSLSNWGCFEHIVNRLHRFRDNGQLRAYACCPAHNDLDPSLSVQVAMDSGKAKLLMKCHGKNCSIGAIAAALNCRVVELFEDYYTQPNRQHQTPVAAKRPEPSAQPVAKRQSGGEAGANREGDNERWWPHSYHPYTMRGEIIYETVRLISSEGKKKYNYRRPARHDEQSPDGWKWNLQGVERILYNLDAIDSLRESSSPRMVFINEGEACADLCIQLLGIHATTAPHGAKKWLPSYSESLRGLNVVVMPDNDQDGFEHACLVVRSLLGVAKSVRTLVLPDLPHKGDVVDWYYRSEVTTEGQQQIRRDEFAALVKSNCKIWKTQQQIDACRLIADLAAGPVRAQSVGSVRGTIPQENLPPSKREDIQSTISNFFSTIGAGNTQDLNKQLKHFQQASELTTADLFLIETTAVKLLDQLQKVQQSLKLVQAIVARNPIDDGSVTGGGGE